MINIGLLGLGTVGIGVAEILNKRQDELKALTGKTVTIKKVLVKDINKNRNIELAANTMTSDFEEILSDDDISIIIEVTGDLEKSYQYITRGLKAKKHIVTANKAVVSKYFEEFSSLADENGVALLYEASVGGGIPVLKSLKEQLALNEITEVQGILNGTCNYILTRMVNEGKGYDEILKTAQELGYAEADPTADVEGHDTLRKLRILSTLALQGKIVEEDILLSGISSITSFDISHIKNMNSTIKLIGETELLDDGFTAVVQPIIVRNDNYFANVDMAYNSVAFKGDNVGALKFYGSGAGKLTTANAVLTDVLDIVMGTYRNGNPLGIKKLKNQNLKIEGQYYLRVSDTDTGILHALRGIAKETLSMGGIIAILTEQIKLEDLNKLLSSLKIEKNKYFLARVLN